MNKALKIMKKALKIMTVILASIVIIFVVLFVIEEIEGMKRWEKTYQKVLPQNEIKLPYKRSDYIKIKEHDYTYWNSDKPISAKASFSHLNNNYFVSENCFYKLYIFDSIYSELFLKDFPYDLYRPVLDCDEILKIELSNHREKWAYLFSYNGKFKLEEYDYFSPEFSKDELKEIIAGISASHQSTDVTSDALNDNDNLKSLKLLTDKTGQNEWYMFLHYKKADGLFYTYDIPFYICEYNEHYYLCNCDFYDMYIHKRIEQLPLYKMPDTFVERINESIIDESKKLSWVEKS